MIIDKEQILKAVAVAQIKGTIATRVWEMQLQDFNASILDMVAEDLYSKIGSKFESPDDLHNAEWQSELEELCDNFLTRDIKPALTLLPWFSKIDHGLISNYGFGGMRHVPLHVVTTVALIKNKIEKGTTLANLGTPGALKGSLPWFEVVGAIRKYDNRSAIPGEADNTTETRFAALEASAIEKLNIAVGYEVEVLNR